MFRRDIFGPPDMPNPGPDARRAGVTHALRAPFPHLAIDTLA
ncbi:MULTISPECIES: hypothetical protein [Burkholderia]|uniref:Uncharacterized protein n=1 Tax=Burkholderia anthina TaxID=179879 RepID=A0A6P2G4H2_9BURK|nr:MULTISPECIES: hypothetical protein [Burkholderia]VVU48405.1 hypothetical protein BAN20980_01102 [Burkholderia anthina]